MNSFIIIINPMTGKPQGTWKCRACGTVCAGSELYQDPMLTATIWTCSNLACGAICDKISDNEPATLVQFKSEIISK